MLVLQIGFTVRVSVDNGRETWTLVWRRFANSKPITWHFHSLRECEAKMEALEAIAQGRDF